MFNFGKLGVVASAAILLPTMGFAAGGTDVEAGLAVMEADALSILNGSGGAVLIVIGILVAAAIVTFTGRWGSAIAVAGVAAILGYGTQVLNPIAGVTAPIEALDMSAVEAPADAEAIDVSAIAEPSTDLVSL